MRPATIVFLLIAISGMAGNLPKGNGNVPAVLPPNPAWNLVSAGDFETFAAWETLSSGFIHANQSAVCTNASTAILAQNISGLVLSNTYRLTITYTRTNDVGNFYISKGGFGDTSSSFGPTGTNYVRDILCLQPSDPLRFVTVSGWQGVVDDISLVELVP